MTSERFTRPDVVVYAEDETEYWTIPAEWRGAIRRIESVYAFDRASATHVAEVTPSYELHLVETRPVFAEGVGEGLRDQIDNWVIAGAGSSERIGYTHCAELDRQIARLKASGERFVVREIGDPFPRLAEGEYRALLADGFWDELIADLQANAVL